MFVLRRLLRPTSNLYLSDNYTSLVQCSRNLTNEAVRKKRCRLFQEEKERQMSLITRIEKISVEHKGPPEDCSLIMNKGLSTPFNCAMHLREFVVDRSALALVNGVPWDMHRALPEDCELKFLHFKDEDTHHVNMAFWRSCSFLLGHVLETAFKSDKYIELCSFPPPNVRSGSFVYDADLKLGDWKPSSIELRVMSRIIMHLTNQDLRFERLEVDASMAQKMFEDNRFKSQQIPQIASRSKSGHTITLYKVGDHIDISNGPMISTTKQIHRFDLTAVHDVESPDFGPLSRVQGVATPRELWIHYWSYDLITKRARKLNNAPFPTLKKDSVFVSELRS